MPVMLGLHDLAAFNALLFHLSQLIFSISTYNVEKNLYGVFVCDQFDEKENVHLSILINSGGNFFVNLDTLTWKTVYEYS